MLVVCNDKKNDFLDLQKKESLGHCDQYFVESSLVSSQTLSSSSVDGGTTVR